MTSSLPREYFQRLYDQSEDPWRISDGWYEERKRTLVLASLPTSRFSVAFEPGCSNGDLSVLLAARCDRLIAWDVVEAAVARTRDRTADLPGVEIRVGGLPDDWPEEVADLIVLSEVGYYLDESDLTRAITQATARLGNGGTLVAVHWRHAAAGYPLTGDRVHQVLGTQPRLHRLGGYHDADFLLDVFQTGRPSSVAQDQGMLETV